MSISERHSQASDSPPARGARPLVARTRRHGTFLFVSGQTAVRDGALVAHGRVGDGIDLDGARECAWQCARNVVNEIASAVDDLERVRAITRITVYVASDPTFELQHLVADAATQYFLEVFGESVGIHARAAIGVAALPTGSPVEVDATVEIEA